MQPAVTLTCAPWNFSAATAVHGVMQETVAAFEAAHRGVRVQIVAGNGCCNPGGDTASLIAGSAANVFTDNDFAAFRGTRYLLPLSPYLKQDNVDLAAWPKQEIAALNTPDGIFALPVYYNIQVYAVNLSRFDDAGLEYPAPAKGAASSGPAQLYMISPGTARPDLAWALLKWVCVEPAWQTAMMQLCLVPPGVNALWPQWETQVRAVAPPLRGKTLHAFSDAALQGYAYPYPGFRYADVSAKALVGQMLGQLLARRVGVKVAFEHTARQIDALEERRHPVGAGRRGGPGVSGERAADRRGNTGAVGAGEGRVWKGGLEGAWRGPRHRRAPSPVVGRCRPAPPGADRRLPAHDLLRRHPGAGPAWSPAVRRGSPPHLYHCAWIAHIVA